MSSLRKTRDLWLRKIKDALQFKKEKFQDQADECLLYYSGNHSFMFDANQNTQSRKFCVFNDESDKPKIYVTANKCAECVQILGPVFYHQNPVRTVKPKSLPMPPPDLFGLGMMMPPPPAGAPPEIVAQFMQQQQAAMQFQAIQQRAQMQMSMRGFKSDLVSRMLNYTPREFELYKQSRSAVDEGIIKGMSFLMPEIYQAPGSQARRVGSFYVSADRVVFDPDCENLRDAKWVAVNFVEPCWYAARQRGLESLPSNCMSADAIARAGIDPLGTHHRKIGATADMISYWKVYSRCGLGGRLFPSDDEAQRELDVYGDFQYLEVADGIDFPLNLHPELLRRAFVNQSADEVKQACAWPIPFYQDATHPWPFAELVFHTQPRCVYPIAHLTFGMAYQQFLNWCYSMLAEKVKKTSRDIALIDKSAGEEVYNAIKNGESVHYSAMKRDAGDSWENIVYWLQAPQMNGDIWRVLDAIEFQFEKATGLTDRVYGGGEHADRSATESKIKGDFARVRIDAMSSRVDDWMTLTCRKEGIASQYLYGPQDVAGVLGDDGAQFWAQMVMPKTPEEFATIAEELEYSVEAGSARRPNRELDIENANNIAQYIFGPAMQQYMANGDPTFVNQFMAHYCEVNQIEPPWTFPSFVPPQVQMGQQQMQADQEGKERDRQDRKAEREADRKHDKEKQEAEHKNKKETAKKAA